MTSLVALGPGSNVEALAAHCTADDVDATRRTLLHLAAASANGNSLAAARRLLQRGADVSHKDRRGRTPLHGAVNAGLHDKVRCLLERGADVHAMEARRLTPLRIAAHSAIGNNHNGLSLATLLLGQDAVDSSLGEEGPTGL